MTSGSEGVGNGSRMKTRSRNWLHVDSVRFPPKCAMMYPVLRLTARYVQRSPHSSSITAVLVVESFTEVYFLQNSKTRQIQRFQGSGTDASARS
jgi:hypothetical protein